MTVLLDRLLGKFSPPLEPALVIALHSDFDLQSDSDQQDVEAELDRILSQLITEQEHQTQHNLEQQQQQQRQQQQPQQKTPRQKQDDNSLNSLVDRVQAILPDVPETTIYQAISDAPNPKNLEQIIDILLSLASLPETASSTPRSAAKSKKKRNKKLDTIHLNDVLQRETQKRLIEQAGQHREKIAINNDWAIGDSQISYLAELVGIEVAKINSIYHRKSCNIVLTLDELLNQSESQKRLDGSKDLEWPARLQLQLDFLRTTLLSEDDQVLTRLLIVTDLNPTNALDLWIFLDDLHARYGNLPFNQFISNPTIQTTTFSSSTTNLQPPHNQSISSSASASAGPFTKIARPNRPQPSTEDLEHSLKVLCARREYMQQRARSSRQLIANSSVVSRNKQAIQNTIAFIAAEDARKLTSVIHDWDLQLARRTVKGRQQLKNDSLSIDLHGLTKNQALTITAEHLQTWWTNHSHSVNVFNSTFVRHFKIITGAGTHSVNNKPTLLPTIQKFLDQEKWKWKYDDERSNELIGSVLVVGKSRT
ncbi:hypothetical protein PtA15_11A110 [Puccinia triticina]|uniref:Smr domain-containing protein n=1 Tax=Puccinia triticina TaxID=208348 RepID=A0ABY7CYA7_9BASI|nr:uncharacterized protein PtA15_11A110 [Puccinia triticina]WAQ89422.1 hypothetical protein PtA15_11A110 [Puccinia triticina]